MAEIYDSELSYHEQLAQVEEFERNADQDAIMAIPMSVIELATILKTGRIPPNSSLMLARETLAELPEIFTENGYVTFPFFSRLQGDYQRVFDSLPPVYDPLDGTLIEIERDDSEIMNSVRFYAFARGSEDMFKHLTGISISMSLFNYLSDQLNDPDQAELIAERPSYSAMIDHDDEIMKIAPQLVDQLGQDKLREVLSRCNALRGVPAYLKGTVIRDDMVRSRENEEAVIIASNEPFTLADIAGIDKLSREDRKVLLELLKQS
jgi:hypothetical protein